MGTIKDIKRKVKGKAQKIKGEFQEETAGAKGGMTKARGEANERAADTSMKLRRKINRAKEDVEDAIDRDL